MMTPADIIPRIFLAVILGALIGLEREITQKSAGLRTHILVTLGATLFTVASFSDFFHGLSLMPYDTSDTSRIVRDPSRIAAQIVAGIGFIGGGAVLRHGTNVKGLTTAASLWTMASIGMLVGVGHYRLSVIATLVTFLVLFAIGKIERHFLRKAHKEQNRLRIHLTLAQEQAEASMNWLKSTFDPDILKSELDSDNATHKMDINCIINTATRAVDVNAISKSLNNLPGVDRVSVKTYQAAPERD